MEGDNVTKGRLITGSVIALLLAVAGVGFAEGASTNTPLLPGAGTTITRCTTFLSLSATKSPANLACAKSTTTTVPPTTTTVPPTTTTTTTSGGTCPGGKTTAEAYPSGMLGPYTDTVDINNSNGYNTYILNNGFWGFSGDAQTLCVTTPSKWYDTITFGPAGYGGVQGYPDVQQLYNPAPTSLTSTFNATDPSRSQGTWELAYDIWLTNNYPQDIMVWEDTSASRLIGNGNVVDNPNVTIDGVSYTLVHYGTAAQPERMFIRNTPSTSGSVNLTDIVAYLISIGDVPAGDGVIQSDFGWEVCSTVGTQTFTLNSYTLTNG
jgi:hypothetical protein